MTVYFIRPVNDHSTIKIGESIDYRARVKNIAAYRGDMEVFALRKGGRDVEAVYHAAFASQRIEGEWFSSSEELMNFIAATATPCSEIISKGAPRVVKAKHDAEYDDAALGQRLISFCMGVIAPGQPVYAAHEEVFLSLFEGNKQWTRRRVRALYEGTARRVDAFEIFEMLEASEVPRSKWADVVRPLADSQAEANGLAAVAEYIAPELMEGDGE